MQICDPEHLEVHHLYYKRELLPWEYSDMALITLCDRCHDKETEKPTIKSETAGRSLIEEVRAYFHDTEGRR